MKGFLMKYMTIITALVFVMIVSGCRIDNLEVPEIVVNQPAPNPTPRPPRPRPLPPRPLPPLLRPMHQVLPQVSLFAGQYYGGAYKVNIKNALINLRHRMLSMPNTLHNQTRYINLMNHWNQRATTLGQGLHPWQKLPQYQQFINQINGVSL